MAKAVILLRAFAFNLFFFTWTIALMVLFAPTLALDARHARRGTRLWVRGIVWAMATIVGLGARIQGRAHIPAGPCIIASQHQSLWDTLIFNILFDAPAFVIKKELERIPLYGTYARKLGMIAVDRGGGGGALRGMLARARAALAAGRTIVIFPEGTRTRPGERRPYQRGVAALYAALDVPVVPVALDSGRFWGRRAFVKRSGTITLAFLAPIEPGLGRTAFMGVLAARIAQAQSQPVFVDKIVDGFAETSTDD